MIVRIAVVCVLVGQVACATAPLPNTSPQPTPAVATPVPAVPAADQARAADVASIESILTALYDVISGPAGQDRDWNRFRSLFTAGARLIVGAPAPDGRVPSRSMTVEEYIVSADPFLKRDGFWEREIARRVDRYGNIAQVFSTYESRVNTAASPPFSRGINSIQLVTNGQRWWVVTIFWDYERPGNPIPPEYLPR
ncbi:MAG TPA: hypothetical protein VJ650_09860 [Gemmatimonadaceae bacterium]|nr:hypothetical protein [Gemmatimonadaceae bacterium]